MKSSSISQFYLNNDFNEDEVISIESTQIFATSPLNLKFFINENQTLWNKVNPDSIENFVIGLIQNKKTLNLENNWKFGYFEREELYLSTNPQFIELFSLFKQDIFEMPIKNRTYSPYGKGEFYHGEGFFISKDFKYNNHSFNLTYRKIKGDDFLLLNLDGALFENEEYGLVYQIDVEHYFSYRSMISNRANPEKKAILEGLGEAFDISYSYEIKDFRLETGVQNLFGFIKWKDLPYYYATADSNTIYIGDDGYKHTKPILSGEYNFYADYTQKLYLHYYFYLNQYLNDNFGYSIFALKFGDVARHQIGLNFRENSDRNSNKYSFYYVLKDKSYEIEYSSNNFSFALSFGILNLSYQNFVSGSFKLIF